MTRLGVFVLWMLHFLPLRAQAAIGNGIGRLLYPLAAERRNVGAVNLRLCFPDMSEAEREQPSGHKSAAVDMDRLPGDVTGIRAA
jgi:KDO2-lipid IV(A) lauroyltransferase